MTLRISIGLLVSLFIAVAPGRAGATTAIGSLVGIACGNGPNVIASDVSNAAITPDDLASGTADCPKLCDKWEVYCKAAVKAKAACWTQNRKKYAVLKKAECANAADPDGCIDDLKIEVQTHKDLTAQTVETGLATCEGGGHTQCLMNCN